MAPVCDPRLSQRGCPGDWLYPLQIFYYGCALWVTLVWLGCFSQTVVSVSRRGVSDRLFDRLSFVVVIACFLMCGHTYAHAFGFGDFSADWWIELLFSLPLSFTMFAWISMFLFFYFVAKVETSKLMDMSQVMKKDIIATLCVWTILPVTAIAATVLLHFRTTYGQWTYLIAKAPFLLIMASLATVLAINWKPMTEVFNRSPKKSRRQFWFGGVFLVLLAVVALIRIIVYDRILEIGSPAPWMVLHAFELFAFGCATTSYSTMIFKSSFTSKGIQALRGDKVIIKIEAKAVAAVDVEAGSEENLKSRKSIMSRRGDQSHEHHDGCNHDHSKRASMSVQSHGNGVHSHSLKEDETMEMEEEDSCPCGVCIPRKVAQEYAEEVANPYWRRWPKGWGDIFRYPHPVEDWESRFQCLVVCVFVIAIYLVHACTEGRVRPWWLFIYPLQGFILRFLTGPRFQPDAWFAVYVFIPLFRLKSRYLPGPPKRQAQTDGVLFLGVSFILYLCKQTQASFWILAFFGVFTANQLLFGICPGCMKWHLFSLTGLMPAKMAQESLMVFEVQVKKTSLPSSAASASSSQDARGSTSV